MRNKTTEPISVPTHSNTLKWLAGAAMCLALCMVLPFLTGQIPQVGGMLSPMHIPVLLAGYLCGGWWGMLVGAIAPVLRFLLFGMPPIFPTGLCMCFELAAYGLFSGMLYRKMPRITGSIYLSLVLAMLGGRLVWGLAAAVIYAAAGLDFGMQVFLTGAFIQAAPGIVLHILLIPPIVMLLQRVKLI